MKRKLDLRTGEPVWSAYRAPEVPVAPLTRDARTDILVVGMGVSGAMAAQMLAAEGHAVMMVDRRGPLLGSTPASTALVQFEIDTPLSILSEKIGRERAQDAWRRSRMAVHNLDQRIFSLGINCTLNTPPSLYLAGNVLGAEALQDEAEARKTAGVPATYFNRATMRERYGIDRAAIESWGNLSLDPRKLTTGLLLAAVADGAKLHAPLEVVDLVHHSDGVDVRMSGDGPVIRAGRVVLATGYELVEFVPSAKHRIISTYAMATAQQPQALWPHRAMMWEASDPYLYLRSTRDGRVICGGEDEDFSDEEKRDALIGEKIARISDKLKALLPQLDTRAAHAWAGSFGTTSTGLPFIGPLPHRPRIFAVMGYGGNGITYSQVASEMARTWASGHHDPDEELFAF